MGGIIITIDYIDRGWGDPENPKSNYIILEQPLTRFSNIHVRL